jgi:hypothetical protein
MKFPKPMYDILNLYRGEQVNKVILQKIEHDLMSWLINACEKSGIPTDEIKVIASQNPNNFNAVEINPANLITQELFIFLRRKENKSKECLLTEEGVYNFSADTHFQVILNNGTVRIIFDGSSFDGDNSKDKESGEIDSVFIKYGYDEDRQSRVFFLKGQSKILIIKSNQEKLKYPLDAVIVQDIVIEAKELGIIPLQKILVFSD